MFEKKDPEYDKLKEEARQQALKEIKPELVKMYKEQELEKLKKKSKNWGQVLASEFSNAGDTVFNKQKMADVISSNTNKQGSMFNEDNINRMLGKGSKESSARITRKEKDDKDEEMFSTGKINKMLDKDDQGDDWI